MDGKIIFFTGAGVSAPSGINTFRDANGLWNNNKIDEICNIKTWVKNYDKVHNFYNEIRTSLKDKEPNVVHKYISELQNLLGEDRVINITQNIDDLFEKAEVKKTIHLHGEINYMVCQRVICNEKFYIGNNEFDGVCPKCKQSMVKPNVIFFEEEAPEYYNVKRILNNVESKDILVVIGTMGNVFNINTYIKYIKYSNYQRPTLILNNMEDNIYIDKNNFNYVFFESCTTAIDKIKEIINSKINL